MEEILASIRRIISEDDEAPAEAAAQDAAPEPEPAPAPAPVAARPKPKPVPEPEPEPEPEAELEEEVLELTERVDEPAAFEDDIAFDEPQIAADVEEGLVSAPVADAAASAFGQLVGQMLVSSRGTEGKTLEDIVRELIKPMLRAWLDENLRQIVESRVAEEVERIAARGRR